MYRHGQAPGRLHRVVRRVQSDLLLMGVCFASRLLFFSSLCFGWKRGFFCFVLFRFLMDSVDGWGYGGRLSEEKNVPINRWGVATLTPRTN